MSDEWFFLGANLAIHRTLGVEKQPIVFRPPGYSSFIAVVLMSALRLPPRHDTRILGPGTSAVYVSQCLLLAAASGLLYAWMARRVGPLVAFCAAVFFGANPYSVVLTSFLHYDILHLFVLIAGCLALEVALGARAGNLALVLVGTIWGVAALVRPLTLVLPPFVWAAWRLRDRSSPQRAIARALAFSLGLCLAVAPWTIRNWRLTHRFIPVNAQLWTITWASTAMETGMEPDRYKWYAMAKAHYLPIYARVTGESDYSYLTFVREILPLEDAFRAEALHNIRARPGVYAQNVLRSFATFNTQISAILLTVFRRLQRGVPFQPEWLSAGTLQRDGPARAFGVLFGLMTLLAALGLAAGARLRDPFVIVPVTLQLVLGLTHALTHMDLLYYYAKLPFVVVLAFYALDRLPGGPATVMAAAVTAAALVLSYWTLG
jgi:hypothetical protein